MQKHLPVSMVYLLPVLSCKLGLFTEALIVSKESQSYGALILIQSLLMARGYVWNSAFGFLRKFGA